MCFSLGWLEQVLIWLIIVCAVVAILKLVIPFVLSQLGVGGDVIIRAINIVLWAVIAVYVVYICFALIGCLVGSGGGLGFPALPRR